MTNSKFGHWAVLAGLVLAVAACQEAGSNQEETGRFVQAGGTRLGERDVEAPEIFAATESALWDGRPSLGGVWVAHPAVTTPQRVLIVNQSTGKSIVGALFRRERENPGPRIQLSSDAADELGILAGQPTTLRVVALKREEIAPPAAEAAPEAVAADDAPAEVETAAAPAAEGTGEAEVQPVPEDAPPTSFGRRRPRAEAAADAADAAVAAAPAAPEAAAAPPSAPRAEAANEVPAPEAVPEDRPPTSFGRRQPRDAEASTGGAADDISVAPLDGAAASAEAPAAETLQRPYIQAAIFGTEANANIAAEGLRAVGLSVTLRQTTSNGTSFWRVLVGPAASVAERDAMLAKIKEAGYRDAYPVRG